jgi:hypothetical protein
MLVAVESLVLLLSSILDRFIKAIRPYLLLACACSFPFQGNHFSWPHLLSWVQCTHPPISLSSHTDSLVKVMFPSNRKVCVVRKLRFSKVRSCADPPNGTFGSGRPGCAA